MKKLILAIIAIAFTVGAYAQANPTNTQTSPKNSNNTQKQNMQNNPQELNKNQNLQNNPQDLNRNQNNMQNNPQDFNKNQNLQNNPQDLNRNQNQNLQNHPQDLNNQNQNIQNNRFTKSNPDGILMQNGKLMMVKNGQTTALDHDMTMSNGTKISNGIGTTKDGTKITWKEGQRMDMSGNMDLIKTDKDDNMLAPDSTMKRVK